jgi:hypothetical protein
MSGQWRVKAEIPVPIAQTRLAIFGTERKITAGMFLERTK